MKRWTLWALTVRQNHSQWTHDHKKETPGTTVPGVLVTNLRGRCVARNNDDPPAVSPWSLNIQLASRAAIEACCWDAIWSLIKFP